MITTSQSVNSGLDYSLVQHSGSYPLMWAPKIFLGGHNKNYVYRNGSSYDTLLGGPHVGQGPQEGNKVWRGPRRNTSLISQGNNAFGSKGERKKSVLNRLWLTKRHTLTLSIQGSLKEQKKINSFDWGPNPALLRGYSRLCTRNHSWWTRGTLGCQDGTRIGHMQGKHPTHCAIALAQEKKFKEQCKSLKN